MNKNNNKSKWCTMILNRKNNYFCMYGMLELRPETKKRNLCDYFSSAFLIGALNKKKT